MALEHLVAEHMAFVRRALRRAGVPESAVDDDTQHVFLVAADKLASVRSGSERAFLYGIVLNVAAHARRRIARRREVTDEGVAEISDHLPLPDQLLDEQRLAVLVDESMQGLAPELREVIALIEIEEKTMADAAEILGIPSGTVASRLRRAREEMARVVARARPSRRLQAARRRSR